MQNAAFGQAVGIEASSAAHPPATASGSGPREAEPFPAVASQASGYASSATLTEGALAKAPEPAAAAGEGLSAEGLNMEHVREAIVAALATAGHSSAAQLLGAGDWALDGASVRVTVPGLCKKMISLTVNAAAEKIIRQELHAVPGE